MKVTTMRKKTLEKGSIKVQTSAGLKFLGIRVSSYITVFIVNPIPTGTEWNQSSHCILRDNTR